VLSGTVIGSRCVTCVVLSVVTMIGPALVAAGRFLERGSSVPPCALIEVLPTGSVKKTTGLVTTTSTSWSTTFSGGQTAYVKLQSITPPHATPIKVRFFDKGPDGEKDNCQTTVLVTPLKSPIYTWSVFSEKPFYRLEISISEDVDVGGVTATTFSSK
jgi:hypothetical protein